MTNTKKEISSKIYNDLSGFGSVKQTFDEARKKDKTITLHYSDNDMAIDAPMVQQWLRIRT